MKAFVTGSKGQLGAAFLSYFREKGWDCAGADLDELDIADTGAVLDAVDACRPDLIINCAAHNLVDKAESEPERAYAVNAVGARNLAEAARRRKARLLHFGTDYVFDGKKKAPYIEADAANPLNEYGRSKLKGEEYALAYPGALVLRLSWVYGRGPRHFMSKLLDWAKGPGPLRVSDDEVSVPTFAGDAVNAAMDALKAELAGLWHLSGGEPCSRREWAQAALKAYGVEKAVEPARMADFGLAARRPAYSALSNEALVSALRLDFPHWRDAVERFVRENK